MQIKKRTAILVIHGIGEQSPYETLDSFSRGIIDVMGTDDFKYSHQLLKNKETHEFNKKGSFLRITEKENEQGNNIDIYEYYWANITEKAITVAEIADWVRDTLKATEKFGKKFGEKIKEECAKDQSLDPGSNKEYHRRMKQISRAVTVFRFLISVLLFLIPSVSFTKPLIDKIKSAVSSILVDYVGDIAIYTSMDVKSKHYEHRKMILNGSVKALKYLIEQDDYEQVIVAGHSLGSVIASDTMNKINIHVNINDAFKAKIGKVKGLITFGSPLDKIAFFFTDRVKENEYVRQKFLNDLHCFKVREEYRTTSELVKGGVNKLMEDVIWWNYYHMQDPVSGRLDYYYAQNKLSRFNNEYDKFGIAHLGYWTYKPMYEEIIKEFLIRIK